MKENILQNNTMYEIQTNEKKLHEISSTIELVNAIVMYAYHRNASDIHIDPSLEGLVLKIRVDGILMHADTFSMDIHEELIARIKILAGLRTDIHFVPQDGRFRSELEMSQCDIRVSIIPTHYGENAVLRLLIENKNNSQLSDLGFSQGDEERISRGLSSHQGMILVTGPTGSGKTSTLYSLLKTLSTGKTSIITLEDPVEYALPSIRQIQIREKHGVTFANGLRSIIRQDPDIIMVGEIRDAETAQISTNISLTGHLLLSTLHTNSALGAIPRLIDMGIDPYLVASTLSVVIAQRLVRKICTECKGMGCSGCGGTKFRGRTLLGEVVLVDDELRKYIMTQISLAEIGRYERSQGMVSMYEDGMDKVERGITTKEEVLRVLHE